MSDPEPPTPAAAVRADDSGDAGGDGVKSTALLEKFGAAVGKARALNKVNKLRVTRSIDDLRQLLELTYRATASPTLNRLFYRAPQDHPCWRVTHRLNMLFPAEMADLAAMASTVTDWAHACIESKLRGGVFFVFFFFFFFFFFRM
jgi:hypothetical protein